MALLRSALQEQLGGRQKVGVPGQNLLEPGLDRVRPTLQALQKRPREADRRSVWTRENLRTLERFPGLRRFAGIDRECRAQEPGIGIDGVELRRARRFREPSLDPVPRRLDARQSKVGGGIVGPKVEKSSIDRRRLVPQMTLGKDLRQSKKDLPIIRP